MHAKSDRSSTSIPALIALFAAMLVFLCIIPAWSQVPTTFVGVSLNNATHYPTSTNDFGLLRLWDTPHTQWPYLQPTSTTTTLSTTYLDDALNGACINSHSYVSGTTCGDAVVMYTL